MQTTITNLSDVHVRTRMTPSEARTKANAEGIVVIIPGEGGEFFKAIPEGYGPCGVARGSFECFEAECIAAGWIVEVVK